MTRHSARALHDANLTPFEQNLVDTLNDVANTPDAPQFDAVIIKRRIRRRRSTVTGLVLGAVLIGGGATALALSSLSAGSSPSDASNAGVAATASPSPSGIPGDAPMPWQDPAAALRDQGVEVWTDTGRHTGAGHFPLPAQPHAGTVWTSIECQGSGKVTVTVGPSSYTESCSAGASGTLNADQLPFSTAATRFEVTGDAGVTWGVAVGWSRTAPSH
ncbi:hypothetical protein SAMN06272735_0101 [Streptomyces sp. TLI_55]|uniref:hypothetical protein n=1 Tax=Streptomyces sp. TLI_55 TaxID=1938861 RepID=UPI000BD7BDB7|nr:hypothetical protein [Streptomyces sp. TLI_55]SNX55680.1 hypothetical protein SAMN06272735_0101 [Streptomyces sp. TLI_55]